MTKALRNDSTCFPRLAGLPWLACAIAITAIAQAQTATETVLHNFGGTQKGANPSASLIRDSAGGLYGTTDDGGPAGAGVVYKVDAAGQETVLYSFTGGADGGHPFAGVIPDPEGNLYGTTVNGGTSAQGAEPGSGVVFKLDRAGQETVLYNFTGGADGAEPRGGVIRDSAGNLYGTTYSGGAAGQGVVFKLDTAGHETVLYSFTPTADGGSPEAGVIRDSAGNLYGTTFYGGALSHGAVYKLDAAGQETVLYSFTGGADGGYPVAGVILDSAGNLYGTTGAGGTANFGVVYEVDTAGQETVLYSFTGGADGGGPSAGVIRDSDGNLYGTTNIGGTSNGGVVYKLDTAGQETVLFAFNGANGSHPGAGVIRDSEGNLYGTAQGGGAGGGGVVYKLDNAGQTVLYSFPQVSARPSYGVIGDSDGNLYGTAEYGGTGGQGVVYKVDATGQYTVLYSFTGEADGGTPSSGVIRDSGGDLYGTTSLGGQANAGVVYKLDPAGQETVLYSFTGGTDGANPQAGVILDPAGNLYGTTFAGGAAGKGVVFKVNAAGDDTVLYSFTGGTDGASPVAGVIRDSAGNLYGTTVSGGLSGACVYGCGVVYKLDAAGNQIVLHTFGETDTDGIEPYAGVVRDSAGNLYGTTYYGGPAYPYPGVVYKLNAAGEETILYTFTGGADGGNPFAGVTLDSAGNLYGTTTAGGIATVGGLGVVYELDTTGHETVLYSFLGGAGGSNPYAGVIRDSAGNLYGTAIYGGSQSEGVLFKLTPPVH
jgi:uncharacterized repeat protein (TIGR03803 family)